MEKKYGIETKNLSFVMGYNQTFIGYGLKGENSLLEGEKIILERMIASDLRADHFDNGDEFFSEYWVILKNKLATVNWLVACGPIAVWKCMRKGAKKLAMVRVKSKKPVLIYEAMQEVLKEFS